MQLWVSATATWETIVPTRTKECWFVQSMGWLNGTKLLGDHWFSHGSLKFPAEILPLEHLGINQLMRSFQVIRKDLAQRALAIEERAQLGQKRHGRNAASAAPCSLRFGTEHRELITTLATCLHCDIHCYCRLKHGKHMPFSK